MRERESKREREGGPREAGEREGGREGEMERRLEGRRDGGTDEGTDEGFRGVRIEDIAGVGDGARPSG
jgi:hypothetical protein